MKRGTKFFVNLLKIHSLAIVVFFLLFFEIFNDRWSLILFLCYFLGYIPLTIWKIFKLDKRVFQLIILFVMLLINSIIVYVILSMNVGVNGLIN